MSADKASACIPLQRDAGAFARNAGCLPAISFPSAGRSNLREAAEPPHGPAGSPAAASRLGAPLIGTDPELALYGRYCVSRRLQEEGFGFRFPDIHSALADLFGRAPRRQGIAGTRPTRSA